MNYVKLQLSLYFLLIQINNHDLVTLLAFKYYSHSVFLQLFLLKTQNMSVKVELIQIDLDQLDQIDILI